MAEGLIDKFKLDQGFPIQVEAGKNIVFVGTTPIDEWIVCANGLLIATFHNEFCCAMYMNYLKQSGFKHFTKKMLDLLRDNHAFNQKGILLNKGGNIIR